MFRRGVFGVAGSLLVVLDVALVPVVVADAVEWEERLEVLLFETEGQDLGCCLPVEVGGPIRVLAVAEKLVGEELVLLALEEEFCWA